MAAVPPDHKSLKDEQVYLVGGAVRDELLGLQVKDRDWVVVGARPATLISDGFTQVGADFPVFLHPDSKEEYALARTERKSGKGYQGFICDASETVTLQDDLERRDLTINAMARNAKHQLIDPFHGSSDIDNKILRHVSPAFLEDPLRVMRVARFAARFHPLGFTVAAETIALMKEICTSGELHNLTPERVWQETQRALTEPSPWVFFEVLRECNALAVIMPELDNLFGVPQPEKHHPEIDTGRHALLSLKAASKMSPDPEIRFAALIHDLGKALTPKPKWPAHHGHETRGIAPIKALCSKLKTPKSYRQLSLLACEFHTHVHRAFELRAETLLKVIKACDGLRNPDRFEQFLIACEADAKGRTGLEDCPYPQSNYFRDALQACRNIDAAEIRQRSGLDGKALGQEIDQARVRALSEFKNTYQAANK